jgi:phospholipid/cholesterol/gamma-HCH transport system permease protein
VSAAPALVGWFRAWGHVARFALAVFAAAFSRETYTPITRATALQQVYFAAWQPLPGFILFSALLSLVVVQVTITAARGFGLAGYALELVFRVLVLELIPFVTALMVALRSGSAINTEVALMHASGALQAMEKASVDPMQREFVPRVVATALSVLSLTVLSSAIALILAYLVMYGFSPWGFAEFTRTIAGVYSLPILAGSALKAVAFGVVVAAIPIAAGLQASHHLESAPAAVMGGMVRLMLALALIEIVSVAVKYA